MADLAGEAADPQTSPTRLQELANNHPALRPIVALNPSTYPALVQWLATLNDPAVNVALRQREAREANSATDTGKLARVSVFKREGQGAPAGDRPRPTPIKPQGPTAEPQVPQVKQNPDLPENYQIHPTVRTGSLADQDRGGKTQMVVLLLALLAVAAGAVLLVVYLLRPPNAVNPAGNVGEETGALLDGEGANGGDTGSDEAAGEDEAGGGDAAGEEPKDVKYPPPPQALDFDHFIAPSGNIACKLKEEAVTCTIMSFDFWDTTLRTCGMGPLSLTVTEEEVFLDCSEAPVSTGGAATLSYSDYSSTGAVACQSTMNGMSCWNAVSGKSFALARQGYVFGSEPIVEAGFPWVN